MATHSCPRCGSTCELSEDDLVLGLPFTCACGCRFEPVPRSRPEFLHAEPIERVPEPESRVLPLPPVWRGTALAISVCLGAVWLLQPSLWIVWMFLCSVLLTALCVQRKRSWKAYNDKSFRYFFYDKAVDFLVPMTIVTFFYSLVWMLVEGTSDSTTLQRLRDLETFLDSARSLVSRFTFKPWIAAGIIAVLLIADVAIAMYIRPSDIASRYKDYHRWSKRAYTLIALLCAFSFFGGTMDRPVAHLRLRAEEITSGYAALREETEDALSASVQQKLYERVRDSLMPDAREFLDRAGELDDHLSQLHTNYAALRPYGVRYPPAEALDRYHESRVSSARAIGTTPIRYDEPPPPRRTPPVAPASGREPTIRDHRPEPLPRTLADRSGSGGQRTAGPSPPPDLTAASVEAALAEVRATRPLTGWAVSLLRTSGGKQLLCQFPKSVTSASKSAAFAGVIESYPILGPIVDVFIGAFDKSVETRVERATDGVVDAILRDPGKAAAIIDTEAREIASSASVTQSPSIGSRIRTIAGQIREQLGRIARVNERVSGMLAEERQEQRRALREAAEDARTSSGTPDRQESETDMVRCYCGTRYVGIRTRAQCTGRCF